MSEVTEVRLQSDIVDCKSAVWYIDLTGKGDCVEVTVFGINFQFRAARLALLSSKLHATTLQTTSS